MAGLAFDGFTAEAMSHSIEPVRHAANRRLMPSAVVRPARALSRSLGALAAWARLTKGALHPGAADTVASLDRQTRNLLWSVLTELVSMIGILDAACLPPCAGLAALAALADRLRERVATSAPPAARLVEGAEPPQIFVLAIVLHDLQPCLGRWQPRLEHWRRLRQPVSDWPLLGSCCEDLARTRARLVERGWQLGIALGLCGLGRLLPERPAVVPEIIAPDELARAEDAAPAPLAPALIEAGWHIYVAGATRLPALGLPAGPGALGEAIAALDAFAGEIRAALKGTQCPQRASAAGTITVLAIELLSQNLEPFLTEWRPRYRRFAASGRSEAKWRRAGDCRAALIATSERCRATIDEIARKIGAPPLPGPGTAAIKGAAITGEDEPLRLPPSGRAPRP